MGKFSSNKPILIVEDSDDDFEYTHRAFKESNLVNPVTRCEDGDDALDYVYQRGKYNADNAPRPSIILLDLNMPGIDGQDVLRDLKTSDLYKDIPIVVLTTSDNSTDIEECYALGANTYISKPVEIENFFQAIKCLKEYWIELAITPKS